MLLFGVTAPLKGGQQKSPAEDRAFALRILGESALQERAHRFRDRFVENMIVNIVQHVFAVGFAGEKGADPSVIALDWHGRLHDLKGEGCGHGGFSHRFRCYNFRHS